MQLEKNQGDHAGLEEVADRRDRQHASAVR